MGVTTGQGFYLGISFPFGSIRFGSVLFFVFVFVDFALFCQNANEVGNTNEATNEKWKIKAPHDLPQEGVYSAERGVSRKGEWVGYLTRRPTKLIELKNFFSRRTLQFHSISFLCFWINGKFHFVSFFSTTNLLISHSNLWRIIIMR